MANKPISQDTALTSPASGDLIPIVDISEAAAADKNKSVTISVLTTYFNANLSFNNYTHPNHTGDVTSVGDGAQTIAANAVSNTKLADMAAYTIKVRNAGTSGDPSDVKISALGTSAPFTGSLLGENGSGELARYSLTSFWTTDEIEVTSPSDKQILEYDSGTGKWVNVTPSSGGLAWSYQTANYSPAAGEGVLMNSGGTARTVTLPATVAEGDEFVVHHLNTGSVSVLVTVARNGNAIRYAGVSVGDDVALQPGETLHLVASAAGNLEIV